MNKTIDVLCIGAVVVDLPLRPVDTSIFEKESCPVERISLMTGGDALNEAIILSRLGREVSLISKIGKDLAGSFILESCHRESVNSTYLKVDENIDTAITVALVQDNGERTFITNHNGSLWKTTINDIDFSVFENAKVLSMASIFSSPLLDGLALTKLFREAKNKDLIICADTVHPKTGETLEDIQPALEFVDYFFPNYAEAVLLSGESDVNRIADVFLSCNVKNVIIKCGKDGCFVKNSKTQFYSHAIPDVNIVDTIGAGDNFVACFIDALLDNKTLIKCAEIANAGASIAIQSEGATSGLISKEQVYKVLDNKKINIFKTKDF